MNFLPFNVKLCDFSLFCYSTTFIMRWGSKVSTATQFGLNGPRMESAPVQTRLGAHPASLQWVCTRSLSSGKVAGMRRWPPTSSRAEVKERAELYLYLPSWP